MRSSMEDEFLPVLRGPFMLNSRWSATVAKSGGEWKIVNLHLSSDVFTNSLAAELTRALGTRAGRGWSLAGWRDGWWGGGARAGWYKRFGGSGGI